MAHRSTSDKYILLLASIGAIISLCWSCGPLTHTCNVFHCPANKTYGSNPNYTLASSTCHSYGIDFNSTDNITSQFVNCCNNHTICYQSCQKADTKYSCDAKFTICIDNICHSVDATHNKTNSKACHHLEDILKSHINDRNDCSNYTSYQANACCH